MNLVTVEVPPPIAGDTLGSVVDFGPGGIKSFNARDSGWMIRFRIGDIIKFGYQGRSYVISGPGNAQGNA